MPPQIIRPAFRACLAPHTFRAFLARLAPRPFLPFLSFLPSLPFRVSRTPKIVFALLPILFITGCAWYMKMLEGDVPQFETNPRFSLNVAYINEGWPSDVTKLPLVQQEVLRTMGTPDMAHLWWDRKRPIATAAEVHQIKTAFKSKYEPIKVTWIYLDKKKEVLFKKDHDFEVIPLSDKIQTLCEVGDPNEVKQFVTGGKRMETWIYYGYGRIYQFTDDVLTGIDNVTPVPSYTRE